MPNLSELLIYDFSTSGIFVRRPTPELSWHECPHCGELHSPHPSEGQFIPLEPIYTSEPTAGNSGLRKIPTDTWFFEFDDWTLTPSET